MPNTMFTEIFRKLLKLLRIGPKDLGGPTPKLLRASKVCEAPGKTTQCVRPFCARVVKHAGTARQLFCVLVGGGVE